MKCSSTYQYGILTTPVWMDAGTDISVEEYLSGDFKLSPTIYRPNKRPQPGLDDGQVIRPLPTPDNDELARLFSEEELQERWLGGMPVYQAAIFNNNPALLGGKRMPDFEIDESKWHPFFQKNKWFDLKHKIVDDFPTNGKIDSRLPADAIWSVDEPVIWEALRPCIEMANRVFQQSLKHPFWDAILAGTHEWTAKMGQEEGMSESPYLAEDRDPAVRMPEEELKKNLLEYSKYFAISFMPLPDDRCWTGQGMYLSERIWSLCLP